MATKGTEHLSHQWETVKDEKSGIQIDFPHTPLEMSFDIPFQNTPPKGVVHLYSVPTSSGLLVLSIFKSNEISTNWLTKEKLNNFFNQILVPHFFYNPKIFNEKQIFEFVPQSIKKLHEATFQITYVDHGTEKMLQGISTVKDHFLYTYFYLSASREFDHELLQHFINSVKWNG